MHLNKNHTFSRRALAMLLTLTLCLSLVPSAFAAQQNSYHDPAEHWMQASNRTNELDVNSVVTRETFKCGECGKVTSFEVFRVPEYTRNGQTALSRNVKYSDGTMMDGVGKGDCMDGVPGKDAYETLLAELEQDIVYKGGIEFPREGPELKQYLPRLCAVHPGWDGKTRWNVQQKEMQDLIRAGKAYDQRQAPKKKHRSHGGEVR